MVGTDGINYLVTIYYNSTNERTNKKKIVHTVFGDNTMTLLALRCVLLAHVFRLCECPTRWLSKYTYIQHPYSYIRE